MTDVVKMSRQEIEAVRGLEDHTLATQQQIKLRYQHVLHAGMYSRSVLIPAGRYITGALIKIPTQIIVAGDVIARIGANEVRITGYAVLEAAANRKSVFTAICDSVVTMAFATSAKTVEEAEEEFTDEASRLASRREVSECLE